MIVLYRTLAFFHLISPQKIALYKFNQDLLRSHQKTPAYQKVKEIQHIKTAHELEKRLDQELAQEYPNSLVIRRIIAHPAFDISMINSLSQFEVNHLPSPIQSILNQAQSIREDYFTMQDKKRKRLIAIRNTCHQTVEKLYIKDTSAYEQMCENLKMQEQIALIEKIKIRTTLQIPSVIPPQSSSFLNWDERKKEIKSQQAKQINNEQTLRNYLEKKILQGTLSKERYQQKISGMYWKYWHKLANNQIPLSEKGLEEYFTTPKL